MVQRNKFLPSFIEKTLTFIAFVNRFELGCSKKSEGRKVREWVSAMGTRVNHHLSRLQISEPT